MFNFFLCTVLTCVRGNFQNVLREKFDQFDAAQRKTIPGLDTIVFVRLVLLLFPASDYRHPVVTPAYTLICSILSRARPTDRATFAGVQCVSDQRMA